MKNSLKFILAIFVTSAILCGCNNQTDNNSSVSDYQSSTIQQSSSEVSENSIDTSLYIESSETSVDTSSIYNFDKKYFVNKLDEDMLKNFVALYNAVSNFQEYVSFEQTITVNELDTLMYLLNYDCPELIQVSGDYFPEYISNDEITNVSAVTFQYIMNEDEYTDYMTQLNAFFDNLKTSVEGKSEFETEKYVYDLLFNNCVYNETDSLSGSVCGVLLKGKGRCESLSKSFLWCMQELDIECMAFLGEPLWESDSVYAKHSWNIVKIDGNYYHIDLTVDNIPTTENEINPAFYGFFNVDDSFISESHVIDPIYKELGLPECNSTDYNYHIMNNLYIGESTDIESDLDKILTENFDNGLENVSIKFSSYDDYCYITENIHDYTSNFLANISDIEYTYTNIYNDIAQTIIFDAEPKE